MSKTLAIISNNSNCSKSIHYSKSIANLKSSELNKNQFKTPNKVTPLKLSAKKNTPHANMVINDR